MGGAKLDHFIYVYLDSFNELALGGGELSHEAHNFLLFLMKCFFHSHMTSQVIYE